jgi:predicted patatin/cPLA2 family phospholipase
MKITLYLICSIVAFAAILAPVQAGANGKCYALALQGGGDKAAYQAGALAQIIAERGAEAQYDVITGVGIGAINGAILASHQKGDEAKAIQDILNFWGNLQEKDIYTNWSWGGAVRGLLFKSSLYDSSPFRKLLNKLVKSPVRKFEVLATNAYDGTPKIWNQDVDLATLIKAIDASAAYPGFFEPVSDIDNNTYYDGGTSYSINLGGAIDACKKLGFAESDIVVDTILCSAATIKEKDTSDYTSIPMLIRYLEIRLYYDTMDLLERAKDGYRTVDFRYTIAPTKKLTSGLVPFSFSKKQIDNMISIGKSDAKDAIARGDQKSTQMILDYTKQKVAHQFKGDYADYLAQHEA